MSAIVAGKACKKCGESFWESLGHPKWFDDVVKHRKPKGPTFLWFERLLKSGCCISCFEEPPVEKQPDDPGIPAFQKRISSILGSKMTKLGGRARFVAFRDKPSPRDKYDDEKDQNNNN